jgi:hypothetical protein
MGLNLSSFKATKIGFCDSKKKKTIYRGGTKACIHHLDFQYNKILMPFLTPKIP